MSLNTHPGELQCYSNIVKAIEEHLGTYDMLVSIDKNGLMVSKIYKQADGWNVKILQLPFNCVSRTYSLLNTAVIDFIKNTVSSRRVVAALHSGSAINQRLYIAHGLKYYHCTNTCEFIGKLAGEENVGICKLFYLSQMNRWCDQCVPKNLQALIHLWSVILPVLPTNV